MHRPTDSPTTNNDPFIWLTHDHNHILSLFRQFLQHKNTTIKSRINTFEHIKQAVEKHEKIEEKIFYPTAKRTEEVRELGFESYEEHFVLNFLLNKLDEMPKEHEEWQPTFTVLFENMERHFAKEEKEIFEKMRKSLTQEQLNQIMAEIIELTK
ncbi:MAG TPA: hemerythrin domain-containing protein [Patescibacteria group bacterium]|nr:hemerythrin domain-containing protein [Patescibacteria group bacterium]